MSTNLETPAKLVQWDWDGIHLHLRGIQGAG